MEPEKILRVKARAEGGWVIETVTGIEFSGHLFLTKEAAEKAAAEWALTPWITALVTGVVEEEAA